MALVKRAVAELLTHPAECECARCEAGTTARVQHAYLIASA
jgi:hypothetical protein